MNFRFNRQPEPFHRYAGDALQPDHRFGNIVIEREPMLFQSSVEFTRGACGPITHYVLDLLKAYLSAGIYSALRIDTRSHMLSKGDYPVYPGYHCEFWDACPDTHMPYEPVNMATRHFTFLLGNSADEFVGNRNLEVPKEIGNPICWRAIDRAITNMCIESIECPTGQLLEYDATELRRGLPYQGSGIGWRYCFRATYFPVPHSLAGQFSNKVRPQTQVYCDINSSSPENR